MSHGTHAHKPLRAESHLLCIGRGTCASLEWLLGRAGCRAGTGPHTELSRPHQQPQGWWKPPRALLLVPVCGVCLLLTAPAHLFSDYQFLVLVSFSGGGEQMGRMCLMTLFLIKRSLSTGKERRGFCQGAWHLMQIEGLRYAELFHPHPG